MPSPDDTTPTKDNWQPGDLALCIRGGPLGYFKAQDFPRAGVVYKVAAVGFAIFTDPPSEEFASLALTLEDGPPNSDGSCQWASIRFRKLHPPKSEEEVERKVEWELYV